MVYVLMTTAQIMNTYHLDQGEGILGKELTKQQPHAQDPDHVVEQEIHMVIIQYIVTGDELLLINIEQSLHLFSLLYHM